MSSVDFKPAQQSHAPVRRQLILPSIQETLLGLALAIAVIAVYYPVHWQPFANYDDPDYVGDNVHIRAGLNWTTIRWAMTARDAANWHPVTWLSHALDTTLFGVTPSGPHDVNVLLHVVNALLLFWVLRRATGFVGRSWMVAALFALHPVNVESVAWIAERKNLLSMFFFLLALEAYRRYVGTLIPTHPKRRDEWGTRLRYLLVVVLFALGLMSKPQVITLPFVLLLWDYWPLQRIAIRFSPFAFRQRCHTGISGEERRAKGEERVGEQQTLSLGDVLLEKVPLLGLCLISAVMTLNAQALGGATTSFGRWLRLENAVVAYARYIAEAFWPSHLALFYPYSLKPYPAIELAGALALLLGVTAVVVLMPSRRYLTVGWLWFLGTLVPMIGVIQVGTQAMADRYAYLPFVGLFIMVCWLAADLAAETQLPPMLLRGACVAILAALAVVSHRQVGFWNDHITLWSHTLEVTHDNWVAENNLGTALLKDGRPEEAIPHFRAAVALFPSDPNSNINIGTYEQMHGNLFAAIERYKAAAGFARNPKTKARAYNNLGYAYKGIGDLVDARDSFQQSVKADPNYSGAWISLGIVAQRTGDLPLAVNAYSRALQIYPSDYGYLLLAGALEQSGQHAQAENARATAGRLSKNLAAAQRYANELLNH